MYPFSSDIILTRYLCLLNVKPRDTTPIRTVNIVTVALNSVDSFLTAGSILQLAHLTVAIPPPPRLSPSLCQVQVT